MFKSIKLFVFALCLVMSASMVANAGVTVYEKDDMNLKLGGLFQMWGTLNQDGNAAGDGFGSDFYVRRMRLMTYGQMSKKVNFFIETDIPNFGKDGNFDPNMFLQDAYLEIAFSKYFQLDMGLLLTPFSHHGMMGAVGLMTLDYHVPLAQYPPATNKVWRDLGLMGRGLLFGEKLEYRLAVTAGAHGNATDTTYTYTDPADPDREITFEAEDADPRNPNSLPRLTARLTYNFFDAEGGAGVGGMFYDGMYIKKTPGGIVSTKKVLSVGASFDWQKDMNIVFEDDDPGPGGGGERGVKDKSDYMAFAADVFMDMPLDDAKLMALTGQVNFYYYNHGDRSEERHLYNLMGSNTLKNPFTGMGIASELGFRYSAFQVLAIVDWFNSTEAMGDQGDHLGIHGGINYFMMAHNVSFKAQAGTAKTHGGDFGFSGILQAQLLF